MIRKEKMAVLMAVPGDGVTMTGQHDDVAIMTVGPEGQKKPWNKPDVSSTSRVCGRY